MSHRTINLSSAASATIYLDESTIQKTIVIIIPGGNYLYTSKREKKPVVDMFAEHGYQAAVLNYTTYLNDNSVTIDRLVGEVTGLVNIIKQNADEWHVDASRIFLCGFSAGGHLAAIASSRLGKRMIRGVILCYPAMGSEYIRGLRTKKLSTAERPSFIKLFTHKPVSEVAANTPATFIWHTAKDLRVLSQGSIDYAVKLLEMRVPCELHVYQHGQHGLSVATEACARTKIGVNQHVASWTKLACSWIQAQK